MNVTRLGAVVQAGSSFGFQPVIFLALVSALVVQAQEALPSMQFNVPYRCADGTAYVIQRCESGAKGEVCFFHVEANGQRESDRYMARAQFTDMMKRCPVSTAPKPAVQPASAATAPIGIPNRPTDPPYLREMPSPERVIREIQGTDPMDTVARQVTVLGQMGRAVERMVDAKRYRKTADEQQVMYTYSFAAYELSQTFAKTHSPEDLKALAALETRHEMNNALYVEALNKFYSPAILAAHAKVDAQFAVIYKDRIEAARVAAANVQQQGGAARQQGNSPVAGSESRTPVKPAVPAVGPPDIGIAKARAANVDTKLFGIPPGEPLAIPKCAGGLLETPSTNCFETHEMMEGLVAAIVGANPDPGAPTVVTIQLTPGNCPTWMDACSFDARIENGRFVAARLGTKGRDVEAAVGKELRGKYGQRASMQQRSISPNNGGATFEVWDLDWDLPGLHIEYKVVNSTILDGYVRIESDTIYSVRKAGEREAAKPKL
jgi:hypothetical protein